MKRKMWWLTGIAIIIFTLVIGGKIYMDKRVEQEKEDLIEVEHMVAQATKNTFENLKSIQIIENKGKNNQTGSYLLFICIENEKNKKVQFSAIYVKGEKSLLNYGIENEEIQLKGLTTNTVHLTYSNGEVDNI